MRNRQNGVLRLGVFGLVLIAGLLLVSSVYSRTIPARHWVFFTDKGRLERLSREEKLAFVRDRLTPRSWQRRLKRNPAASLNEHLLWQDLPVFPAYLDSLRAVGLHIHRISRWLNAVSVWGSDRALQSARRFPFVQAIQPVRSWQIPRVQRLKDASLPGSAPEKLPRAELDYGLADFQVRFHRIPEVHEQMFTGAGIRIGVFDTGFNLDHPALVALQDQIVGEYDFIQNDTVTHNQPGDPPGQDDHGTLVLSVLAGWDPGRLIGVAFDAQFVLAKTEDIAHERHVEEDNWARAAEWADSLGVDLVSTSLGYSTFDAGEGDYSYADMDGETTIVTRAANFLAQRGVLVVSAAGNEGNKPWHFITAPGDGKWVLTVGAVDTFNLVTAFSSRGPTADGRIKPDVVALGTQVYAALSRTGGYGRFQGTSLSTPLAAGIAALAWQANPELSLTQMLEIMRGSGDHQPPLGPDNERGWGRVDAVRALTLARQGGVVPQKFSLAAATPNPFFPPDELAFIRVRLPVGGPVSIQIYNARGQRVRTMNFTGLAGNEWVNAFPWDGRNQQRELLPSGVYIYLVQTPVGSAAGKLVLLH